MNYLPGERVVWRTKDNGLILTTHRIRWHMTHWGKKRIVSIMLEEVQSCEIRYEKYNILVVVAVSAIILGMFGAAVLDDGWAAFIMGVGVGLVFFGLFQITRRLVLIISAGNSAIVVNTGRWSSEVAIEMIDKLEAMKNRRYFRPLKQGLETKEVTRS